VLIEALICTMNKKPIAHKLFLLFTGTLIFLNCDLKRPDADFDKVNDEIKERKIKKHKESEVVTTAYEKGKVVMRLFEKEMGFDKDTLNPSSICTSINLQSIQSKIESELYKSVKLYCSEAPTYNEKQKKIWDAYKKAAEYDTELYDNIQFIKEGNFYFYSVPYRYLTEDNVRKIALLGVEIDKKETILEMQRNM
jgi:hypothetical protein